MLHVLPIAFPILILKGLFYFEAKVRSVKANAYDSAYASALSEHAVHGALAGLTCVSVVPYLVREVGNVRWLAIGWVVFQLFTIGIFTWCPFPLTCSHLDKVRMYSKTVYIPIHACQHLRDGHIFWTVHDYPEGEGLGKKAMLGGFDGDLVSFHTSSCFQPFWMQWEIKSQGTSDVPSNHLLNHDLFPGFPFERFDVLSHQGVTHPKRVNPLGRWFGRMAFTTGQPRFEPDGQETEWNLEAKKGPPRWI